MSLAESALIANAVIQSSTGLGMVDFFTNTTGGSSSYNITAREVVDGLFGGNAGIYGPSATKAGISATVGGVVGRNLKMNAVPLVAQLILIPVGFRVAKKMLARPLINPVNRVVRNAGIKGVKL